MPIIGVRDNENNRWKRDAKKKKKKKNNDRKEQGGGSCSERVWAKWYCGAFKFRFYSN